MCEKKKMKRNNEEKPWKNIPCHPQTFSCRIHIHAKFMRITFQSTRPSYENIITRGKTQHPIIIKERHVFFLLFPFHFIIVACIDFYEVIFSPFFAQWERCRYDVARNLPANIDRCIFKLIGYPIDDFRCASFFSFLNRLYSTLIVIGNWYP